MRKNVPSYHSPKIEVRGSDIEGYGVFAKEKINKDELLIDFTNGPGQMIRTEEAARLFDAENDHMIQIDDDLYFAATTKDEMETGDYLNHSCDPNCGIKNRLQMVAMRDIMPNEEIAFDYAMSESSGFSMKCACGAQNCRGTVSGEDWKRKDLQEKYRGYFTDYLARRIAALS